MKTNAPADTGVTHIRPARGWLSLDPAELWRHRELLFFLTRRDIAVRYKQTLLGAGWALLQPLLLMVVFSVFFGLLARIPSDGIPYPLFAYAGLIGWQIFAYALTEASNSLVAHQNLITKVYFPRLIIPVAATLPALVDFAIASLLLIVMLVFFGRLPGADIIFLPFFVGLALLTALGVGIWLSALNVRYRDVRYTLPFLTQVWLFATPIAYPSSLVPEALRPLFGLNPMVSVAEGLRWSFLGTTAPSLAMVATSTTAALVVLVSGMYYFRRVERGFADVI